MSISRIQHQRLLLGLLSPARTVLQSDIDQLGDDDWQLMADMVRQHRLAPLLHWMTTKHHAHLVLPEPMRRSWNDACHRTTLRALQAQREMVIIHRMLTAADIPLLPLKGAYLAFHAYPQAGLRPLRDLDILVPPDRVLEAFNLLLEGGAQRLPRYASQPETHLTAGRKHLPPLRSPGGDILIELHAHLFPDDDPASPSPDLIDDPGFWQRKIERVVGGDRIGFVSPIDLMLHLIVHAVYDHKFDNGPLLLADLGFLIASDPIDWPAFWHLAERMGRVRGAVLALKMLDHGWGDQGIDYGPVAAVASTVTDTVIDAAMLLMLRDFDMRGEVYMHRTMSAGSPIGQRLRHIAAQIFPSRIELATMYPVDPTSPGIFRFYPINWWRLASQRLPAYLGARRQHHMIDEGTRLETLDDWLLLPERR